MQKMDLIYNKFAIYCK